MSSSSATALETVAQGLGLLALADQAKGQAMHVYTAQHAKKLQRQVRVQESRRLDAAADATLGKGDTGLTDDAVRKHRETRKTRNRNCWKQRASKSPDTQQTGGRSNGPRYHSVRGDLGLGA